MLKKFLLSFLVALSISTIHAQTVAYVVNSGSNTVSVIDTSTNALTATIAVGTSPFGVVVSPDGTRAYVTNFADGTVSVIDTASNTVTATISLGAGAQAVFPAITPDGKSLYVGTSGGVTVLSTATNSVTATIPVLASVVAITPDGAHAYAFGLFGDISVIDTATNTVVGSPIAVTSLQPGVVIPGIAVTPGGGEVYVVGGSDPDVPVISTATNTVVATIPLPAAMPAGALPVGLAITPDGGRVYVSDVNGNVVDVIDTETKTVEPSVIPVGSGPAGVAVTPDGASVYVANSGDNTVSVIATGTNTVTGSPIAVGAVPFTIAIANLGAPFAAFTIDNLVINNQGFHEQGDFTLGGNTGGIDLAHQPLTLTVGSFSLTIPAGSFRQVGGNMHFVFNGAVNGLSINFNLQAVNGSSTQFAYVVNVHGADLTGQPNPVTVGLKIGHNSGTTTAEF